MRLRPDPVQAAIGALVIGLTVFLIGVTLAWRSSSGPSGPAGPAASSPAVLPTSLEPGPQEPAAEGTNDAAQPAELTAEEPATKPPVPAAIPAARSVPPVAASNAPFFGMGTWVDVFDWAPSYAKGKPIKLAPSTVDVMADHGVQVLYIQTTRADYPGEGDIVDPPVLEQWLARAEARGMQVVAWYLPTLTDVGADLRRLKATGALATVDGIGVDIESRAVVDHDERSRRLVELSRLARSALAGRPLSAITLPNVVTDVLNLKYWPRFPWAEIKPFYDVWQPMAYWTNRKADSPYRDAERYTQDNVQWMRAKLGDPNAVVHPIGGIGDKTTPKDIEGFLSAARRTKAIGASLYDWSTQSTASYAPMRAARS